MLRIAEEISSRVYGFDNEGNPIELSEEGYRLSDGSEVLYRGGKWVDAEEHEYSPVYVGNTDTQAAKRLLGFVQRDTLSDVDKKILSSSPEGAAYAEYERLIGGERIGLSVPTGYPPRVQEYLDEGGTLERLYRELIELGITWYEYFSTYPVERRQELICDMEYEEIHW